jgi:hypothetical protein
MRTEEQLLGLRPDIEKQTTEVTTLERIPARTLAFGMAAKCFI